MRRSNRSIARALSACFSAGLLFGVTLMVGAASASAQPVSGTGLPRTLRYEREVLRYAQNHKIPFDAAVRRVEWQRLAPGLQKDAKRTISSAFGGLWIDNADGGRIKLGIVGSKPALLAQAHAVMANSDLAGAVDIVRVPRTERELNEILAWVAARLSVANRGSSTPLTVGILPDQNAVRVSMSSEVDLTLPQHRLLVKASKRYGSAVKIGVYGDGITPEACSYPFCTPPLRSGIKVGPAATFGGTPGGICTAGFLSRGKEDSNLYQLTAGHCNVVSGSWGSRPGSVKDAWREIGAWSKASVTEAGDAGMYQVSKDSFWHARPWVYWAGQAESYPIYSDADVVQGQEVCKSGAAYGTTSCGKVIEVSILLEINYGPPLGVKKVKVSRANYCSVVGDSGSPVHYYGVAYGIHTGGSGECNAYFSSIHAAEEALNVDVRHESKCDPLFESSIKTGDINGDDKDDVFQFSDDGNGNAWESTGSGFSSLGQIGTDFGNAYQDRVGDMDGDGDDDLFRVTDEGDLYAWESSGSSYTYLGLIASGFGSVCDTRFAYINGDAKIDILRFTNDGYAYGWLAKEGGGYEELGQLGASFGSTYQDRTGDINGDGDDDLFQIDNNGKVFEWNSNGLSYTGGAQLLGGVGNASQVRFGDMDGDGDDDIFRFTDSKVGSLWKSKGSSYEIIGAIGTEFGLTHQMHVADIDGDADADILKFDDEGSAYAWISNGISFAYIGKIESEFGKLSHPDFGLSVLKTGDGTGKVTSNPEGIDCGDTCSAKFEEGSTVVLTPVAEPGSEFREWNGACSGVETTCEVAMSEVKEITVRFSRARPTLTLEKTGYGSVKSKPKGIACGNTCPEAIAKYYRGTVVVLRAKAPTGAKFTGWEGCKVLVQTELESTCEVTMSAAKTVKATFAPALKPLVNPQTLSLSKAPATAGAQGYGTVKATGITCEAACTSTKAPYYGGITEPKPKAAATVTLLAIPAVGSEFSGWTGCESEPEGKCVVLMSKAQSVSAEFTAKPARSLTLEKTGYGSVKSKPKGIACGNTCSQAIASLPDGTIVVLGAKAPTGAKFTGWEGCKVLVQTELESTCEVTMSAAETVKATFAPALKPLVNPQTLILAKAGSGSGTVKAAGLTCEAACAQTAVAYYGGVTTGAQPKTAATVILIAASTFGSDPVQWEGCESELAGSCVVPMGKAQSVVARFEE